MMRENIVVKREEFSVKLQEVYINDPTAKVYVSGGDNMAPLLLVTTPSENPEFVQVKAFIEDEKKHLVFEESDSSEEYWWKIE